MSEPSLFLSPVDLLSLLEPLGLTRAAQDLVAHPPVTLPPPVQPQPGFYDWLTQALSFHRSPGQEQARMQQLQHVLSAPQPQASPPSQPLTQFLPRKEQQEFGALWPLGGGFALDRGADVPLLPLPPGYAPTPRPLRLLMPGGWLGELTSMRGGYSRQPSPGLRPLLDPLWPGGVNFSVGKLF